MLCCIVFLTFITDSFSLSFKDDYFNSKAIQVSNIECVGPGYPGIFFSRFWVHQKRERKQCHFSPKKIMVVRREAGKKRKMAKKMSILAIGR